MLNDFHADTDAQERDAHKRAVGQSSTPVMSGKEATRAAMADVFKDLHMSGDPLVCAFCGQRIDFDTLACGC